MQLTDPKLQPTLANLRHLQSELAMYQTLYNELITLLDVETHEDALTKLYKLCNK